MTPGFFYCFTPKNEIGQHGSSARKGQPKYYHAEEGEWEMVEHGTRSVSVLEGLCRDKQEKDEGIGGRGAILLEGTPSGPVNIGCLGV